MSRTAPRLATLFVLLLCSAGIAFAQGPTTGTPPFGSYGGGPEIINLANLNAHWSIPILNKPGRGTNFSYELGYDSSVWSPLTSGSSKSWQPAYNFGWIGQTAIKTGYISYSRVSQNCDDPKPPFHQYVIFQSFAYHDPFGGIHPFAGQMESDPTNCDNGTTSTLASVATDGSGYSLAAAINGAPNVSSAKVTTTTGQVIAPPLNSGTGSATSTDRNGNEINVNGSGQFFDTLNSTVPVLTVAGTGSSSSPNTFTYTTPSGASAAYTMNFTNYTVATNFSVSGVTDYKSTAAVPLVSSVVLPDNSLYTFTYEPTPGTCTPYSGTTCVTARIKSVTLPTGGVISYAYSGGNNGILPDGSTATLTRTTPDGTWTYARTTGTGAASATLITAPKLSYDTTANQTIAQFQGIYPTQTNAYQGSAPTFTTLPISEATLQTAGLLQETQICYNASASPCPTLSVTLPITQRTVQSRLAGSGALWAQHTDKFNALGLQTESDDYDFAAAPPGTRLQQTTISYATLGGSLSAFPQTVEVLNAAGTIQSRQDTAYDGATPTCISGAPQHDDTDFPCTFNVRGNATSVTTYTSPAVPSGGTTKNFTYDSLGNLLTAQLNCCQEKTWVYSTTTAYAYPDSVTSGSSAPQLTTTMTYDLNMGLTLTSTDPNNLKATNTYDAMGRPLTTVVGSNPAISYTYADFNNSSTFTPWTVNVCSPVQGTATACQKTIADSQGRTATSQLLDSSSTLYSATDTQYDTWGRAFKVSNPYTTSAAYWTQTNTDGIGRTVKTTLQDSSVSTSSYTDNTVTATDPAGKQRKGLSDALGRLTSVYEPDPTTGSLNVQTSYTYNVFNQLTQVTQGSQTRTYVYDALARLNSSTTPEAGTVCLGTYSGSTCQSNGYDSFNNLLYRTDARGVVTNYLYDTLNRLVGITYPTVPTGVSPMPNVCKANGATSSNADVCLTYGTSATNFNNGLPTSMTDGSGSESYTYNSLEQVTQRQKVIGTSTYTTSYAYNLANELSQITYPSGRIVAQSFDAIGRLCAVGASGSTCTTGTTFATGFTYNTTQQPTSFNYGNGVAASFGYSPDRLQLTSLSYTKSGTTLFGLGYSYGTAGSNDGLISSVTDSVQSGRTVGYTYDSLSRLATALTSGSTAYPQWGISWTYDRYANRTLQMVTAGTGIPSSTNPVSATTNRLTGVPYAYDSSGNVTNDGLNTVTYDGENRATGSTNGSTSGTYSYDGAGLRVRRIAGTTTTSYVFSGSKVIAEYDNGAGAASPSREYIYAGTTLIAKTNSTTTNYYHQDLLSNRMVTNSSGAISEELGHYPYGESWYNVSSDKLFFTTYERDSESGNDYAQARYYINRFGRFSSVDLLAGTAADPQTLNRYTYVTNNPISLTDSSGLCPKNQPSCRTRVIAYPCFFSCDLGGSAGSAPTCLLDDVEIDCGTLQGLTQGGATNGSSSLSTSNPATGIMNVYLPPDCLSEGTNPTDPDILGASSQLLGCDPAEFQTYFTQLNTTGSSGSPGPLVPLNAPTIRATPTLRFRPPSLSNFANEFLPCYGAQVVYQLIGSDGAEITIPTIALTAVKPVIGGTLSVVWLGIVAGKAGVGCTISSRGYYQ
jgi:RHS repeat-associated protein